MVSKVVLTILIVAVASVTLIGASIMNLLNAPLTKPLPPWRPAERQIGVAYDIKAIPDTITLAPDQSKEIAIKVLNAEPVERTLTLYLAKLGESTLEAEKEARGMTTMPQGITETFDNKVVVLSAAQTKFPHYSEAELEQKTTINKLTITTSKDLKPGTYQLALASYVDFDSMRSVKEIPIELIVQG